MTHLPFGFTTVHPGVCMYKFVFYETFALFHADSAPSAWWWSWYRTTRWKWRKEDREGFYFYCFILSAVCLLVWLSQVFALCACFCFFVFGLASMLFIFICIIKKQLCIPLQQVKSFFLCLYICLFLCLSLNLSISSVSCFQVNLISSLKSFLLR